MSGFERPPSIDPVTGGGGGSNCRAPVAEKESERQLAILNGKVAIVTRGGRGTGRAHALAPAAEGAAVMVNDPGAEFTGRASHCRRRRPRR
ncbi:hypothetical protein [Streptomyces sp900129855]|uniref:Uncharacterized protein n=1 Tax=Streptomyces sp. 900129855 TaxID=3155129 RepID=A0ABV2ZW52_9ACTN